VSRVPGPLGSLLDDVGVIAEHIRGIPELIAVLSSIEKHTIAMDGEVTKMRRAVERLEKRVEELNGRVDGLVGNVSDLEPHLAEMRTTLRPMRRVADRLGFGRRPGAPVEIDSEPLEPDSAPTELPDRGD
jgi:hypothetical protein